MVSVFIGRSYLFVSGVSAACLSDYTIMGFPVVVVWVAVRMGIPHAVSRPQPRADAHAHLHCKLPHYCCSIFHKN
jgi:hypothetical protein